MDEAREVVFGAVDGLLRKTGLAPKDIDILVTTCSIFCPTPSMAAMVVNHYKLKQSIQVGHSRHPARFTGACLHTALTPLISLLCACCDCFSPRSLSCHQP